MLMNSLKSLIRLPFYLPLRMLRFATKLIVLGCGVWIITTNSDDQFSWLFAGLLAFVVLVGIDLVLRWIGPPRLFAIGLPLMLTWTVVAHAAPQSCNASQAELDALAGANWGQVMQDAVPECALNGSGPPVKGAGTCVSLSLAPGDVLPGDGSSLIDASGNTWSLSAPAQDGSGHWYGAMVFNGQQVDAGYWAALRLVGGQVYAEQAKGAGWVITSAGNPGDTGNVLPYTDDPGTSGICGGSSSAGLAAKTPTPTQPVTAAIPAPQTSTGPGGNYNLAPFADTSCGGQTYDWTAGGNTALSGGITPGTGTITDISGNTYTIDSTNYNTATINGEPITPNGESSNTQAMTIIDGKIYGQDATTNQWFAMIPGPGGEYSYEWQPLTDLPASGQTPTPTTRWTTAQSGLLPVTVANAAGKPGTGSLNTAGSFAQAMGYFEATLAPGGNFSLITGNTNIVVGEVPASDTSNHVFGISITSKDTIWFEDAQETAEISTPSSYKKPAYLTASNAQTVKAFPNINDALACVPGQ